VSSMRYIARPTDQEFAEVDRALLLENGRMRLMPAQELLSWGLWRLQAWCILRARYQFVTTELVAWLKDRIAGRSALEIGAGQGDLGWHLGIRQIDLGGQREAFAASGMRALEQMPTDPPLDIERIDAESAVRKYAPEVVVGAWITQTHHLPTAGVHPSIAAYGVEEIRIVGAVDTYIHVGNDLVHGQKRILGRKHRTYRPPWLVSRGADQGKNAIRVWDREK
jgi:hypothetical protein